jgi:hypothetical protein
MKPRFCRLDRLGHVGLVLAASLTLVAAVPTAQAGSKNDFLRFLPADPTAAGVMNLAQGKKNALFVKAAEQMRKFAGSSGDPIAKLGVDIAKDLNTISCGAAAKKNDVQPFVCVLDGNFAKAAGLSPTAGSPGTSIHEGITIVTVDSTDFALVGKQLLVTNVGEMVAAINRGLGKAPSALASKKAAWLKSALASARSGRQVWAALVPDAEQSAQVREKTGAAVSWMAMSLTFGDPIVVEMRAKTKSPAEADAMVTAVTALAAEQQKTLTAMGLTGLAASISVDRKDTLVRFNAAAPTKEIETIVNLAKMLR